MRHVVPSIGDGFGMWCQEDHRVSGRTGPVFRPVVIDHKLTFKTNATSLSPSLSLSPRDIEELQCRARTHTHTHTHTLTQVHGLLLSESILPYNFCLPVKGDAGRSWPRAHPVHTSLGLLPSGRRLKVALQPVKNGNVRPLRWLS